LNSEYRPWIGGLIGSKITCNVRECRLADVLHIVVKQASTGRSLHYGKGKGKAVLLQAWSGPEVSRKLRFPDFITAAQDSGKVVSLTQQPPLPPGNIPGTHFC